jgi:hypothetical protein
MSNEFETFDETRDIELAAIAESLPDAKLEDVHFSVDEFGKIKNTLNLQDVNDYNIISFKQYFIDDVFFRERDVRKVQFDELFLDLIFVAVFHHMGHFFSKASLHHAVEFWIVFYFVWKTWVSPLLI